MIHQAVKCNRLVNSKHQFSIARLGSDSCGHDLTLQLVGQGCPSSIDIPTDN